MQAMPPRVELGNPGPSVPDMACVEGTMQLQLACLLLGSALWAKFGRSCNSIGSSWLCSNHCNLEAAPAGMLATPPPCPRSGVEFVCPCCRS